MTDIPSIPPGSPQAPPIAPEFNRPGAAAPSATSQALTSRAPASATVTRIKSLFDRITAEIAKIYVGQDELVLGTLVALFSSGHVLIESVPGWARRCSCGRWAGCWAASAAASSSRPT